ncbi:aminoglycoside 3'-phosphotransferase [Microbacterium sp. zg.Y625]|uniref:aminoglycoside 3'-phosphotransferase n=1 Tax=Microbacterium jiangjiandongii TaxID=3049071 RepID=UPI00214B6F3B|nr:MULTISPECIES: aminoglycoside 3'-phosphotransferase [unclassified Microbacterium]MCR2793424.1 aminoglycoside 3'-phosphotransferase [Microbacterium sp. zg.Y625]WIM25205.1 aminoglycoside 3'-phosphotransferase [Microbacterium sp. zg-Y625]
MSIPLSPLEVPTRVRALAAGAALIPVWRNKRGGVTFRTDDGRYIKHGPRNAETTMAGEADRLGWAAAHTPVPRVLDHGTEGDEEWLVTAALPGRSAVDPRWIAEPAVAVRALGEGLRALHDALPVATCPYDWSVPARVANAAVRGIRVPAALHQAPPVDVLVVCHGDACAPNTLLDDAGQWSGHVDLDSLGVADRWADIAVAAMSTGWNYGPGWEDALLDAYGIARDPERMSFYAALWDAT